MSQAVQAVARASRQRTRIQLLGVLLGATMIATAGFTINGVESVRSHTDDFVYRTGALLSLLTDIDRGLLDGQLSLKCVAAADDEQEAQAYTLILTERKQQVHRRLDRYTRVMHDEPGYADQVAALAQSVKAWETQSGALLEALLKKTPQEKLVADFDAIENEFARARRLLGNLESQFHDPQNAGSSRDLIVQAASLQTQIICTIAAGMIVSLILILSIRRLVVSQEASLRERLREQERDQVQREFDRRIQTALGMARTQEAVLQVVADATEEHWPGTPLSVLLADSSRAHLGQVIGTPAATEGHKCSVPTPNDCPAVRQGNRLCFLNNQHFDACPQLKHRPGEAISGLCIPISAMGHAIGVMHVCGQPDRQPDNAFVDNLILLASRAGDRIGVLRAFAQSELQATTDPLTGLLNRRSLESKIQELASENKTYCLAYTDIDHFKKLNDMHGHDTGDRALRLFSQTLHNSVRPTDWVARWGGEEFVLVLPDTALPEAEQVLHRIQKALAQAVGAGGVPTFTASFGLAGPCAGENFNARLELADEALLLAKRNGRNRIEICSADCRVADSQSDLCLNVELPPPAEPATVTPTT